MRHLIITAAATALLRAPAAAETYQAAGVRIEDAAAVIEIIPEARSTIDVVVQPGARLAAPRVSVVDGHVLIDGDLRIQGCTSTSGGGDRVRVARHGVVRREDLPRITVRAPRTLDASLGGAVYTRVGESNGGRLSLVGCGETEIAPVNGDLRLQLTGSGNATLGAVSGKLDASLTGSGQVRGARVGGDAALRLTGSGNLNLAAIGGELEASLTGSGNLGAGDVGRGAAVTLTGSGDVGMGDVRGALSARVSGSGDVLAQSVHGPEADLRTNSSGDIIVRGGRVERFRARASGSGDVRFDGAAAVVDVEMRGSGDVSIADAGRVERLISNGSGNLRTGAR